MKSIGIGMTLGIIAAAIGFPTMGLWSFFVAAFLIMFIIGIGQWPKFKARSDEEVDITIAKHEEQGRRSLG